ncbi:hypothetical protein HHX47_DHR2000350 [Lentinula edodes]|nr:hypothetical protein HHX47_DHR2000350 [Lentinula edodes]
MARYSCITLRAVFIHCGDFRAVPTRAGSGVFAPCRSTSARRYITEIVDRCENESDSLQEVILWSWWTLRVREPRTIARQSNRSTHRQTSRNLVNDEKSIFPVEVGIGAKVDASSVSTIVRRGKEAAYIFRAFRGSVGKSFSWDIPVV